MLLSTRSLSLSEAVAVTSSFRNVGCSVGCDGDMNGWACDGKNFPRGCKSGCTGFNQLKGKMRYKCTNGCDFDLCEKCVREYCTQLGHAGVSAVHYGSTVKPLKDATSPTDVAPLEEPMKRSVDYDAFLYPSKNPSAPPIQGPIETEGVLEVVESEPQAAVISSWSYTGYCTPTMTEPIFKYRNDDARVYPAGYNIAEQLRTLNDLKMQGVLSLEEFEDAKAKTLGH